MGTEILRLKMTTSSRVGYLQEVKARAIETKNNLQKAQEAVIVSVPHCKNLTDEVTSLTEDLPSISCERANLGADVREISVPVQLLRGYVENALSRVFTEVRKTYADTGGAVKSRNQEVLVDAWKKLMSQF